MVTRYHFIDLLKACAVLMMIQGHTLDAALNLIDRQTEIYRFMYILRGFTAPAFLIGAGFSLGFSFSKKRDLPVAVQLKQRVLRITPIILVGYFLHLPYFSLTKFMTSLTRDQWTSFLQCDVLQTIGYTVLLLQILLILLKNRIAIVVVALLWVVAVLLMTPHLRYSPGLPLFVTQLVSPAYGSLFPIFPFSAYLSAGVLCGQLFMLVNEKFGLKTVRTGFIITGLVIAFSSLTFSNENLSVFLLRSGILIALCGMLILFEGKENKIITFLAKIGQESFPVYYLHIMIVYGSAINKGFSFYYGKSLNTFQSVCLAIILTVLMVITALSWSFLKKRDRELAKTVRNALIASLISVFLIGR